MVAAALTEVDITAVVREHVDLDAIAEGIDIERIVDRVDIERIVDRVDVDAIAARVDIAPILDRVDVDAVTARVDIERIVDRVDVNAIAAKVDVDRIAASVDVDAVIGGSTWSGCPTRSSRASTCRGSSGNRPARCRPRRCGAPVRREWRPTTPSPASSAACSVVRNVRVVQVTGHDRTPSP